MFERTLLTQTVCPPVPMAELKLIVAFGVTVIVPLNDGLLQEEPVVVTVNGKLPLAVGVPLITKSFPLSTPLTPAGKAPEVIEIPVAPPPRV